jgi:hypothetical protein
MGIRPWEVEHYKENVAGLTERRLCFMCFRDAQPGANHANTVESETELIAKAWEIHISRALELIEKADQSTLIGTGFPANPTRCRLRRNYRQRYKSSEKELKSQLSQGE